MKYNWNCSVCNNSNEKSLEYCDTCNSCSSLNSIEIEERKAALINGTYFDDRIGEAPPISTVRGKHHQFLEDLSLGKNKNAKSIGLLVLCIGIFVVLAKSTISLSEGNSNLPEFLLMQGVVLYLFYDIYRFFIGKTTYLRSWATPSKKEYVYLRWVGFIFDIVFIAIIQIRA